MGALISSLIFFGIVLYFSSIKQAAIDARVKDKRSANGDWVYTKVRTSFFTGKRTTEYYYVKTGERVEIDGNKDDGFFLRPYTAGYIPQPPIIAEAQFKYDYEMDVFNNDYIRETALKYAAEKGEKFIKCPRYVVPKNKLKTQYYRIFYSDLYELATGKRYSITAEKNEETGEHEFFKWYLSDNLNWDNVKHVPYRGVRSGRIIDWSTGEKQKISVREAFELLPNKSMGTHILDYPFEGNFANVDVKEIFGEECKDLIKKRKDWIKLHIPNEKFYAGGLDDPNFYSYSAVSDELKQHGVGYTKQFGYYFYYEERELYE